MSAITVHTLSFPRFHLRQLIVRSTYIHNFALYRQRTVNIFHRTVSVQSYFLLFTFSFYSHHFASHFPLFMLVGLQTWVLHEGAVATRQFGC